MFIILIFFLFFIISNYLIILILISNIIFESARYFQSETDVNWYELIELFNYQEKEELYDDNIWFFLPATVDDKNTVSRYSFFILMIINVVQFFFGTIPFYRER